MSQEHPDITHEPIPGLPEELPEGETILWQGSPNWRDLALHAFHLRSVGIYFAILAALRAGFEAANGAPIAAVIGAGLSVLPWLLLVSGILATIALIYAKTSIFTITTRRVVLRFGVAMTKAMNLPFSKIHAASVRKRGRGFGDIALELQDDQRIGYLHLWPMVRPRHFKLPQPMLRALPKVEATGELLARAVSDAAEESGRDIRLADRSDDRDERALNDVNAAAGLATAG